MTVTGLLPVVVVRLHGPEALKVVADAVSGVSTVKLNIAVGSAAAPRTIASDFIGRRPLVAPKERHVG